MQLIFAQFLRQNPSGDNEVFGDEDQDIINEGGSVEIRFTAQSKEEDADDATARDMELINEKVVEQRAAEQSPSLEIGMILDFKVNKITRASGAEEAQTQNIPELNELLKIVVPLPIELQGLGTYKVYRVHKGKELAELTTSDDTTAERIEFVTVKDTDNNIDRVVSIIIYAKNFSTYAFAVTSEKDVISVTPPLTLFANEKTITAKVDNNVTSQAIELEVSERAVWKLYKDSAFTEEIIDKKMSSLNVGENRAYVRVIAADDTTKDYTIIITRQAAPATEGSDDTPLLELRNVEINVSNYGLVSVYPKNPKNGDKVTITITPNEGYELYELNIINSNGTEISFTDNGDGTYTYIHPTGLATIDAKFKKISDEEETTDEATPETDDKVEIDDSDVSALLNTKDHIAYVSGVGNNEFAPSKNMTRAEAAQMFYNVLINKNVETTRSFADVAGNMWYTKAVNALASLDIITGYPDGGFHPNDMITRAQFATIVVRFAKVAPGEKRFDDVLNNHWAYDYINTAANFSWVLGIGDGSFEPERNITRAEAVTVINKMLRREADKEFVDTNNTLIRFSDVAPSHWAYYQIMEAANTHEYTRKENGEGWR